MLPDPAILLVVKMKTNSRNIFTPRGSVPKPDSEVCARHRPSGRPCPGLLAPRPGGAGVWGARPAPGAVGGAGGGLAALRGRRRAQSGGERAEAPEEKARDRASASAALAVHTGPAAPGQRLPRHIPHLLPRKRKKKQKNTNRLPYDRTAPPPHPRRAPPPPRTRRTGRRCAAPPDRRPLRMPASRRCAVPPYGAGAVRPRAVAPPPLAAGWARGRCQEPPWPRPCPRLRAEAAAEPAGRPWLPGAVGVGPRCSPSLPFCRSPFPAARSGVPGGESEERRRDPDPPAA